jgi:WD40 repeat protein
MTVTELRTAAPVADDHRLNPFVGLEPYAEEDREYFFGRAEDIIRVTANLRAQRLTVLYGPSGVGKTSLLRAGVIRDLHRHQRGRNRRGQTPGFCVIYFDAWHDADPLPRFEEAVTDALSVAWGGVDVPFGSGDRNLSSLLDACATALGTDESPGEVLVVFDQFEQFFLTHRELSWDPNGFPFQLGMALSSTALAANFLISIREDWLSRLDAFQGRVTGIFEHCLRVGFMNSANARLAIECPIERINQDRPADRAVALEPGLIEAILADQYLAAENAPAREQRASVPGSEKDGPGINTPFLQLALTRLWREDIEGSGGNVLKLDTFITKLGGARRIIEDHVLWVMNGLTPDERLLADAIAPHLTSPDGAKVPSSAKALARKADAKDEAGVSAVLAKLSDRHRGILREVSPPPGQPDAHRFELMHDVLGQFVLDWRARYRETLIVRRYRRWAPFIAAFMAILAATAAFLWLVALDHEADSRAYALAASSHLESEEVGVLLARQSFAFRRKGADARVELQIEQALRAALGSPHPAYQRFLGPVAPLAIGTRGDTFVVVSRVKDGVELLNFAQGLVPVAAPLEMAIANGSAAAVSGDGRVVVVGTEEGNVCGRNEPATKVARPQCLRPHSSEVFFIALNHDGSRGISMSRDGDLQFWRPGDTTAIGIVDDTTRFRSAAISADGRRVAAIARDGGTIHVFSTTISRGSVPILAFRPVLANPLVVSFGQSDLLAIGDEAGRIEIRHPPFREAGELLPENGGPTQSITILSDTLLAVVLRDGAVRLRQKRAKEWILAGEMRSTGHAVTGAVSTARVPRTLVLGWEDGGIRGWLLDSLAGATPLVRQFGADGLSWVPIQGGRNVAVVRQTKNGGDREASLEIVDVESQVSVSTTPLDRADVVAIGVSGSGTLMAVAYESGDVQVVDVSNASHPVAGNGIRIPSYSPRNLAVNQSGNVILALDVTGRAWRWDVVQNSLVRLQTEGLGSLNMDVAPAGDIAVITDRLGHVRVFARDGRVRKVLAADEGYAMCAAFDPSGDTLAICQFDGRLGLWAWKVSDHIGARLAGPVGTSLSEVHFSDDGLMLAGTVRGGPIRLWHRVRRESWFTSLMRYGPTIIGRRQGDPDPSPLDAEHDLRGLWFGAGGRLITAGADGTLHRLETSLDSLANIACRSAGHNLSFPDWERYVGPASTYQATCPGPADPSFRDTARDMILAGHPRDARRVIERAASLTPASDVEAEWRRVNGLATLQLARQLAIAGRPDTAVALFRSAVAFHSSLRDSLSSVSGLMYMRADFQVNADTVFENALDQFRRTWSFDSTGASVSQLNGICWYGGLRGYAMDQSVWSACQRAVFQDPDNYSAVDSRGLVAALRGNYSLAASDFAFFANRTPDHAEARRRRGWVTSLRGSPPSNPITRDTLRVLDRFDE